MKSNEHVMERLMAAYIAKSEAAELALQADPEALRKWGSKHVAGKRYDDAVGKLIEMMLSELDWFEIKTALNSEELLKQIRAV